MVSNKFHSLELSHPIISLFLGPCVDIYLHIQKTYQKTETAGGIGISWDFWGCFLVGAHLVSQQVESSDFRFEISASETAGGTVSKYHLQRSSVGCRSGIKMVYFPQDQHMYIYIYMVLSSLYVLQKISWRFLIRFYRYSNIRSIQCYYSYLYI